MAVRFDDSEFRLSHGKAPRGRGGWAFRFRDESGYHVDPSVDLETYPRYLAETFFAPSSTFADAKKWARAKARELGADVVEVCS